MINYKTHLCTFMGREENLEILIPYIESALEIDAIDNYWFVDMTRKRSDHELIIKEHARLNSVFPGRVHLYNSESRSKIIDDPEAIKEASNDWSVFYKMLETFNDNDIIAKCDDDTYYIDVETLKAAFELRWNHQQPYLMHANCINNGVTVYHQNKKNTWKKKNELDMYPIGGLTGPLFSFPDIACEHHMQFTRDMIQHKGNIDSYKLNKNIHFTNRVSINFIFMLGKDRHTLKNITRQDEYDTSCKYPQREDRPNMIIGDFTIAHHTYGVQEPVMDRRQTRDGYLTLSKQISNREYSHKEINKDYHTVSAIKTTDDVYLCKAWVQSNSYCLQDPDTKLYISLDDVEVANKNGLFLKSRWSSTTNLKEACVLNIDTKQNNCIWINNSIQIIRPPEHLDKPQEGAMMGFTFFQGLYKKCKMDITTQGTSCTISPEGKPEYTLSHFKGGENIPIDHKSRKRLLWKKDNPFKWEMIPVNRYHNHVLTATITRPSEFYKYTNDSTSARNQLADIPDNNAPKDYIWTVKDYIWEFIPVSNNQYHIRLIADDSDEMYLCQLSNGTLGVQSAPEVWHIDGNKLKYNKSGLYITINPDTSEITLSNSGTILKFNKPKTL